MPQGWTTHWPLADGAAGLEYYPALMAAADSPVAKASRDRHAIVQTLGNLTIVSQALNSSVSNREWALKKPALLKASLLPINLQLQLADHWDEKAVTSHGATLCDRALTIWARS